LSLQKEVLAGTAILGSVARRRFWSAPEKAALLAEVDAEGAKVRLGRPDGTTWLKISSINAFGTQSGGS
jgi:hypothetical protein